MRTQTYKIILALAACVVVLVTFWNIIAPRPSTTPPLVVQPLPTSKPPTVNIVSNTNYGSITINGQRQRSTLPLTVTMSGQPPSGASPFGR